MRYHNNFVYTTYVQTVKDEIDTICFTNSMLQILKQVFVRCSKIYIQFSWVCTKTVAINSKGKNARTTTNSYLAKDKALCGNTVSFSLNIMSTNDELPITNAFIC